MIFKISSGRSPAIAAALGLASLLFAFNAGSALGGGLGGALGGVGNAVGGALGGVGNAVGGALGGGRGSAPGGAGAGNDASGGAQASASAGTGGEGFGASAQSGRAAASGKKKLKRLVITDDGERCRTTLFDLLRGRNCNDRRTAADDGEADEVDQASASTSDEAPTPKPKPKSRKSAGQAHPPARNTASAPEKTARLDIKKPAVEKPKPSLSPKLIAPKAVKKLQPKPEPTLSCDQAGTIVGGYGFSTIAPSDCDGEVYAFNASRDGKSFTITLNAVSGELIAVRKVP